MAARGPFVTLEIEENWLSVIESAVNLRMTPEEFASRAVSVDLERAVEVLREMGFRVPERIALKADLQDELEESHRQGQRLSEAQIEEFHRRVWGAE